MNTQQIIKVVKNQLTALRQMISYLSIIIGIVISFKTQTHASSESFEQLGPLEIYEAEGWATSADGKISAGFGRINNTSARRALIFTGGNAIELGTLGGAESRAWAISGNGNVVVGEALTASGNQHAFKYSELTGMSDLGTLGGTWSTAFGVSGNGSYVVGQSAISTGRGQAFKHSDATGMVNLGTLAGNESKAYAISSDGVVTTGWSTTSGGGKHAFKHTESGGMEDLGTLGGTESYGFGISPDGKYIVGSSAVSYGGMHAFKHSADNGMLDLGTLGGSTSIAYGSSYNGKTIVGMSQLPNGMNRAFRYTDKIGMVDIGTLGGSYSSAHGVSHDGSIIVGTSSDITGRMKAFIWKLSPDPERPSDGTLIDADNTKKTMFDLSQDTFLALDLHAAQLSRIAELDCDSSAGEMCISLSTITSSANNETKLMQTAMIGHRFTDKTRAGFLLGTSSASDAAEDLSREEDTHAVSFYVAFDRFQNKSGPGGRISASASNGEDNFKRKSLPFTESSDDISSIHGYLIKAEMFYGIDLKKLTIDPYVYLSSYKMTRDAYEEKTSLAFPARLKAIETSNSKIGLGINVGYSFNDWIRSEVSSDFSSIIEAKTSPFRGSIDYLSDYEFDSNKMRRVTTNAEGKVYFTITKSVETSVGASWSQQDFGHDTIGGNVALKLTF